MMDAFLQDIIKQAPTMVVLVYLVIRLDMRLNEMTDVLVRLIERQHTREQNETKRNET